MERSKVKNVIIIILLAVNIALLALLLRDALAQRSAREKAVGDLTAILANYGMTLNPEAVKTEDDTYLLNAKRSAQDESRMAEKLIGKCSVEEQGGNIRLYSGEYGEMYFRGNGDFQTVFTEKVPIQNVLKVLEKNGVSIDVDGDGKFSARQEIDGRAIMDSGVTLTVSDGAPVSLEGRWLVSSADADTDNKIMGSSTAIMRFVAANKDNNYGCGEITGAETAYYMTAQVTGEYTLEPVWVLTGDTGVYIVSASGGVEKLIN